MAKNLNFSYDKLGDTLDVSIGRSQKAVSLEIKDDFFVRLNKKNQIVGFMLLNFQKRFSRQPRFESVPITAEFKLDKIVATAYYKT